MNFQISALAIGIGQGYQNQMATIGLESQVSMFERLKYEEKIRDLKKEFEAALKVQKKEREEECKRLLEELKVCLYIFIHIYLHRYIVYFCMFFSILIEGKRRADSSFEWSTQRWWWQQSQNDETRSSTSLVEKIQ